jgi:hypothetical protein
MISRIESVLIATAFMAELRQAVGAPSEDRLFRCGCRELDAERAPTMVLSRPPPPSLRSMRLGREIQACPP